MRISDWSSDVCSSDLGAMCVFLSSVWVVAVCYLLAALAAGMPPMPSVVPRDTSDSGAFRPSTGGIQIGRASCRERVCQYVSISEVAVSLNKKHRSTTYRQGMHNTKHHKIRHTT